MPNTTEYMRRWMSLFEDAAPVRSPEELLAHYVANYPETVSDRQEDLLHALADEARNGSRFMWAIARMSDGRFVSGLRGSIRRFGLPVVAQGDSDDLPA